MVSPWRGEDTLNHPTVKPPLDIPFLLASHLSRCELFQWLFFENNFLVYFRLENFNQKNVDSREVAWWVIIGLSARQSNHLQTIWTPQTMNNNMLARKNTYSEEKMPKLRSILNQCTIGAIIAIICGLWPKKAIRYYLHKLETNISNNIWNPIWRFLNTVRVGWLPRFFNLVGNTTNN